MENNGETNPFAMLIRMKVNSYGLGDKIPDNAEVLQKLSCRNDLRITK